MVVTTIFTKEQHSINPQNLMLINLLSHYQQNNLQKSIKLFVYKYLICFRELGSTLHEI